VDSLKLLQEINKQGSKLNRKIPCLLQVYIAKEETKFGFEPHEILALVEHFPADFTHLQIKGLMGMASLTDQEKILREEFNELRNLFEHVKQKILPKDIEMQALSMGMSLDYKIALQEGSTLVRIGTAIFGERNYRSKL
ncbi:MAG: YggS family pyridoxal phosphate-dependent enzyme, partial [Flammeovirgaceae bacterium]